MGDALHRGALHPQSREALLSQHMLAIHKILIVVRALHCSPRLWITCISITCLKSPNVTILFSAMSIYLQVLESMLYVHCYKQRGYKGKKTSAVWTRKPQDGSSQLKRLAVRSMLSNRAHPLGGTLAIMRHECSPTAPDHQVDFPVLPQGACGPHVPPLPNPD
jgi:hypothetical protein